MIEYKLSMLCDLIVTVAGIIGTVISHFLFDNIDSFLICGMVSCFSFYNFADSHERYTELLKERDNDT